MLTNTYTNVNIPRRAKTTDQTYVALNVLNTTLYRKVVLLIFTVFCFGFFTVTLVSGFLMFILFVSELSFYLSTEVSVCCTGVVYDNYINALPVSQTPDQSHFVINHIKGANVMDNAS